MNPDTAPDIHVDPVGYCVWGLQNGNAAGRANAADMLRGFGAKADPAVPVLCALLRRDKDTNVRAQCALALMEISYSPQAQTQQAAAPLIEALQKDDDGEVRSLAAGALGEIRACVKTVYFG